MKKEDGQRARRRIAGLLLRGGLMAGAGLGLVGCLVERTVTDSQGNLIYQEPDVVSPFESKEKEMERVKDRRRELGW